jgi:hypothetical protein
LFSKHKEITEVRQLMRFCIHLISFVFLSTSWARPEIPIPSQRTLRQQLALYIELLDKETDKASKPQDKFESLKRARVLMREIAATAAESSHQDHLFAEVLLAGLQTLPNNKQFKKSRCDSYHEDLQKVSSRWESSPVVEEALKPTQEFLQSVCF